MGLATVGSTVGTAWIQILPVGAEGVFVDMQKHPHIARRFILTALHLGKSLVMIRALLP